MLLAVDMEEGAVREGGWLPPKAGRGEETASPLESSEGTQPC